MIPPRSPWGLIQEDLWPSTWLILVSCMMLNCTKRKQVERIMPEFIKRWPTPQNFMNADIDDVQSLIKPLGFASRRSMNLMKMTERFIAAPWEHVSELPGIGEYGSRCYDIFCRGELGLIEPNDGALSIYWKWRRINDEA
jgi:methyl-CpG-binding domain protein 4